jgi:hypothetical protein
MAPRRPVLFPEQYALVVATLLVLLAGIGVVVHALTGG